MKQWGRRQIGPLDRLGPFDRCLQDIGFSTRDQTTNATESVALARHEIPRRWANISYERIAGQREC